MIPTRASAFFNEEGGLGGRRTYIILLCILYTCDLILSCLLVLARLLVLRLITHSLHIDCCRIRGFVMLVPLRLLSQVHVHFRPRVPAYTIPDGRIALQKLFVR
jgi:hypothetical protein